MGPGGCPALSQPPLKLLKPGDAGGRGGSNPEPVGLLLAAQHRHQGRRQEGEGAAHPGRVAQDGGRQGRLCRGHCPQELGH